MRLMFSEPRSFDTVNSWQFKHNKKIENKTDASISAKLLTKF